MEKTNSLIFELRSQILALPMSSSGKRMGISPQLRQAILSAQAPSGLSPEKFCKEIGISYSCYAKWKKDLNGQKQVSISEKGFKRIVIQPSHDQPTKSPGEWVIEGPQGLRISGLSVSELTLLWRSLC